MPVSGLRLQAIHRHAQRVTGGFHKTVHFEQIEHVAGNSSYRPGVASTAFSIRIDPVPLVRIASEEDISEANTNVSLGDYVFEVAGGTITEDQLRSATQIVLNKGGSDEEKMQIQQIRVGDLSEVSRRTQLLSIVQGHVIKWDVFARATKKAA